jgi:eukaryotic-like serine/threonine-protein kinase
LDQLGPYKMVERLGAGGMAEIFRARVHGAEGFHRDCVLKVLHPRLATDPSFGRMLVEEARLTAYLRHPNVVAVHDLGKVGETLFVVMEYVEGTDLHALIASLVKRDLPFPQDIAAYIVREACAGLHYAHTRRDEEGNHLKLVHRDISPHNILISHQGEVKVIDFGVAKIQNEMREKTRAGIIKGKFGYMSPEQAWDHPLDGRSDIFAIGICLYEMLTGCSMYGQLEDPVAMIRRVRAAEIAPPSSVRKDLEPELEQIVLKALAPDREKRYQTAMDLQRDLSAYLARKAPTLAPLDVGAFILNIAEERDTTVRRRLRDDEDALLSDETNPRVPVHADTQPMIETGAEAQTSDEDDEDFQMEATRVFRDERQPTHPDAEVPAGTALRADQSPLFNPTLRSSPESVLKTSVPAAATSDAIPRASKPAPAPLSPFMIVAGALIVIILVALILLSL